MSDEFVKSVFFNNLANEPNSKPDYLFSWWQRLAINVLKQGPIPNHVALITDGNRRFSRENNLSFKEAHLLGYENMAKLSKLLWKLGVKEITTFTFSIDNFNRSPDQVKALMDLANDKLDLFINNKINSNIRIRFFGNLKLFTPAQQEKIAYITKATMHGNDYVLNIAFGYSARDDITNSIRTILKGVQEKRIEISAIDENLVEQCLYTNISSEPDILVRTAGETRFSDFLLWETSSCIFFTTECKWPEFNYWHAFGILFNYQRHHGHMKSVREYLRNYGNKKMTEEQKKRQSDFSDNLKQERLQAFIQAPKIYLN